MGLLLSFLPSLLGGIFGKKSSNPIGEAIEGVAGVAEKYFDKKEDAEDFKKRLKADQENAHQSLLKALGTSRNWFVADSHAFMVWVTGWAVAFYVLPRFAVASYVWVVGYADTGHLGAYPVSTEELWHLLAVTGGFGTLAAASKALQILEGVVRVKGGQ